MTPRELINEARDIAEIQTVYEMVSDYEIPAELSKFLLQCENPLEELVAWHNRVSLTNENLERRITDAMQQQSYRQSCEPQMEP